MGFGRVWIVSPPEGKVVVLDPHSGEVIKEIGVGVDPAAIAVGSGAVWVANRADGTVSRIDPRSYAVTDTITVGRAPAGIAAGPDTVWVTNAGDATVSRFNPSSVGVPKSISVNNPPTAVALLPQGAYVAVGSSGAEHRGGELAVVAVELDSIDPAIAYTAATWSVLALTNDGLVGFRRVGGVQGIQLVPDLALALPVPSDGGRTYRFQLRPGIRYSSGKLVQPGDLRRALERLFQLGSPGASYYGGIEGSDRCKKGKPCDLSRGIVTSRRGRTVSIHLTAPDADFLTKLALTFASAVPARTPAHDVGVHPVPATGPYSIAKYDKKAKLLGSCATPASASGRSMRNRRATPTPSRSLRGSTATPRPESEPFGAVLPTSPWQVGRRRCRNMSSRSSRNATPVSFTAAHSSDSTTSSSTHAFRRSTTSARAAPSTTRSTATRSPRNSAAGSNPPAKSCRRTSRVTARRAPTAQAA